MKPAIIFTLLLLFFGCAEQEEVILPKNPESTSAVMIGIRNKEYKTDRVGFMPADGEDSSIEWVDETKEESKKDKDFYKEVKTFSLKFLDETRLKMTENKRVVDAEYVVNNAYLEGEKEGVYLRIKFPDNTDTANVEDSTRRRNVTYAYHIKGIDGRKLLLQLARSFNDRRVVVMMKSKDASGKD